LRRVIRGVGALLVAVILSGFIAGTIQLEFAVWFGSREEFIVIEMGLVLLILAMTATFGVVLLAGAAAMAVRWTAIAFVVALLLVAVALEIFSVSADGGRVLRGDLPFQVELVIPGLVAILIQLWLLHRHVRARAA
jgi:uncharacterized membrane protein YwaF